MAAKAACGLAAILAYTNVFFLPTIPGVGQGHLVKVLLGHGRAEDWLTAGAVTAAMIAALSSGTFGALLRLRTIHWLGKVSYSLYLLHTVVLFSLVYLLYGVLPLWAILALVLPVSMVAAAAGYRLLEVPSIALGRRLTARAAKRVYRAASVA